MEDLKFNFSRREDGRMVLKCTQLKIEVTSSSKYNCIVGFVKLMPHAYQKFKSDMKDDSMNPEHLATWANTQSLFAIEER